MAWRDNLQPASFAGAAFYVDTTQLSGGARLVTHEYPLKDTPYIESMGRKAEQHQIAAYTLGDNFIDDLNALLDKLRGGVGELIHPYFGRFKCRIQDWSVSTSDSELRIARVNITFANTDTVTATPSQSVSASKALGTTADKITTQGSSDFAGLAKFSDMLDFGVDNAENLMQTATKKITALTSFVSDTEATASGVVTDISDFSQVIRSTLQTPKVLADTFTSLLTRTADLFDDPKDAATQIYNSFSNFENEAVTYPETTPTRKTLNDNAGAIVEMVKTAAMATAANYAAQATFTTQDEANNMRDNLLAQIDDLQAPAALPEQSAATTVSFDQFANLQDAKAQIVEAIPGDDTELPKVFTYTPAQTIPALVLAYKLFNDASLGDNIAEMNNARYPGFLPGGQPLQVVELTNGTSAS